jgi:hypothetical protein
MDVGALTVAIEDHDELGRAVDGCEGVRRHGAELGGLAGLDEDLAFAQRQAHPPLEDEEPVVTGVDPLLGLRVCRFESDLDRDRAAGRSAQHPGGALVRGARRRANDHIVVAAHVQERIEVDLEGRCQGQQDVEADRPLAGLDSTDRGGTEVRAGGELVERQAQRVPKAAQSGPNHLFDLDEVGHRSSDVLADLASTRAYIG